MRDEDAERWQFRIGVVLAFGSGILVGAYAVRDATPPAGLVCHEGTIFLPAPSPTDPNLTEEKWQEALAEFLQPPFQGATLAVPVEGIWRGVDGKFAREAVRPIVVSFPAVHLSTFRERARSLGKRLGQEAIYIRYERPTVELQRLTSEK